MRSSRETRVSPRGRDVEPRTFLAMLTCEYFNKQQHATRWSQEGVVAIRRSPGPGSNDVIYAYGYEAEISAGTSNSAMASLDAAVLVRDRSFDRFAGGDPALKSAGLLANAALAQVRARFIPDGSEQVIPFMYPVSAPLMPPRLDIRLVGHRRHLPPLGEIVLVRAATDPFELRIGTSCHVRARLGVVAILDGTMETLHYWSSRFEATIDGERLVLESLLVSIENGHPAPLGAIADEIAAELSQLGFEDSPAPPKEAPQAAIPIWVPSALIAHNSLVILTGAAIEGKPNFAITATVGLILLLDAGVSVSTTLLHQAGLIDWEWGGIPDFLGRHAGTLMARGYAEASGRPVNEALWADVGGLTGDVLSFFIPSGLANQGAKAVLGTKKITFVAKKIDLAGRALRVSHRGIELVKAARGSAELYRRADRVLTALEAVRTAIDVYQVNERWDLLAGSERAMGLGDVSFRLYWIPPTYDVDLHVRCPQGHHIWYQEMRCPCLGELDRDDTTSGGPENIYWPAGRSPSGRYQVWAEYYEGSGPKTALLEIRRDGRLVQTEQFRLEKMKDRSPIVEVVR